MGKGNDLWDDSALINAFDHAMATYKEMHLNGNHGNPAKEGKHTTDKDWHEFVNLEKTEGNVDPESNSDNISTDAREVGVPHDIDEVAPEDPSTQGNTFRTDVHAPESEPLSSGLPCADGKPPSSSDQQSADYDQLLRQYYELEEQKQKVVQQLHQANYWNYQTPVQSSTSQLPQVSGYNASEHGLQMPGPLCSCHCVAVPLIPSSTCAVCGLSSGCCSYPSQMTSCLGSQACQVLGAHFPAADGPCSLSVTDPANRSGAVDNAVKVGMLAVERAVNSMKTGISGSSHNDKETKDTSSANAEGTMSQSASSDSDLNAVLNAWYLAGFHTGRYLSEQSKKNAHF